MSQPENSESLPTQDTLTWGSRGTDPPQRDLTGATLGDFQVERLLGRGGMGEVYLARQISLNRHVALKMLRPDLLTKPVYLSRFESEALAVARLNHPNIVHIYTLGSVDQLRFIAMEYVQGTTLRDYIIKKGALDLPLSLSIMKQAGVAVGAAGEIGLIHRDIKPENLLLTRKGQVKVADFGLSRDLDENAHHVTATGVTMGTPLYMSPEQAQGKPVDHRSDLYSLGVTFYHMLAGTPPFRADSALAIAMKHVKDTPVSLTVHRPEIPADLDRLVLKLMAKAPGDRYQSAAEMLRDLAKVKESLHAPSVSAPMSSSGITASPTLITEPAPSQGGLAPRSPRASDLRTIGRRLGGVRLGRRGRAALVTVALTIGCLWGWLARPPDLLSANADEASPMPALWMAPGWESITRQETPERQYHYAQIMATADDQEAAWLAVPGYFAGSREWVSRAYIQLARSLLRHHDSDRLRVFADEITRWSPSQTHEKELAIIIQAAVKALDGDLEGVSVDFEHLDLPSMFDPALLELSVEVTGHAAKVAVQGGSSTLALQRLREIQNRLMAKLYLVEFQGPIGRAQPS